MTIIDSSNRLLGWFSENDGFNVEDNFKQLKIISDSGEIIEKAAILCCLEEFEKLNIIKSCEIGKKRYFVLNRPMSTLTQSVVISASTSKCIAGILNAFCDNSKDKTTLCDARNINERDILNLIEVLQLALQNRIEEDGDDEKPASKIEKTPKE